MTEQTEISRTFGTCHGKEHIQNEASISKQRNSAFELCRVLSMLMIVGCHFATHGSFSFDKSTITIPRLWWNVIEMGGNFGVDVFILISGYFMVNNTNLTFNKKRALKIWGQALFYSIIIFLFGNIIGITNSSIVQLIKTIFPITTGAWWFLTTYFVLFLLHPYINRLLHSLNKHQYQGLLILLFIIWCVIPTFTSFSLCSNELIVFVLLYTIAGYIRLFGINAKLKSKHFFLLWLLTSLVTFLSSIAFIFIGKKIAFFANKYLFFYGQRSLPTLLRAVFFFMIFERMNMKNNKIINTIATAAFGVYLIHDSNIIRPWLWKTLFVNAQYQESIMLIPYSLVVIVIVYSVCTLIDLIRINTVEVFYMKFINRYSDRIIAPIKKTINVIKMFLFGKENSVI